MPEETTDIRDMTFEEFLLAYPPMRGGDDGDGGEADAGDAGDGGEVDDAGDASALEGGAEPAEKDSPAKPDVSASIERLNERIDEVLEQNKPGPADEWLDSLGDEEFEDDGGDEEADPYADYEDPEAAAAMQALDERIDERARELLAPHLQAQQEEKRLQQTQALEQRYPDLQKEENAVPLLQAAEQLAKALGEPDLAYEAPFLETVHLRMRAEKAAAEESPAGDGDGTPVEGGGGAASKTPDAGDAAKAIVDAGKAKSIFG